MNIPFTTEQLEDIKEALRNGGEQSAERVRRIITIGNYQTHKGNTEMKSLLKYRCTQILETIETSDNEHTAMNTQELGMAVAMFMEEYAFHANMPDKVGIAKAIKTLFAQHPM